MRGKLMAGGPGKRERSVHRVVAGRETAEGAGFPVRRPLPGPEVRMLDPFLLLDEMGPTDWGPGEAKGAPEHPHRGFETVTYMLAGRFEHRDSFGFSGQLGPGDVQWMTAGSGLVHSELPEESFRRSGGRVHGVQLWVNLPAADKWLPPRYQDTPAGRIPEIDAEWGRARILAGRAFDTEAAIETRIPILYLHLSLAPGSVVTVPIPESYNAFAYLLAGSGEVRIGGRVLSPGDLAILTRDGAVRLTAPETGGPGGELLLVGGEPLDEPVARYGPFVMSTSEEIEQALRDFRDGRMGSLPREG